MKAIIKSKIMNIDELKNKILYAYNVENYAEIAILLLFLKEEYGAPKIFSETDFKVLAAKLVLQSDFHRDLLDNIMIKMKLEDHINYHPNIQEARKSLESEDYVYILNTLVMNEILAMNNYLELFMITKRELISEYFENVDEYYRTFQRLYNEELKHAKMILKYINKIGDIFH